MSRGKSLKGKLADEAEKTILDREEVLQILSEMARKGSVSAAIALERCLRDDDGPVDVDDELERLLGEDSERGD
jgi:hypothetical protein